MLRAAKPVIVAMGGFSASGGYCVACPANVILALPSTLTGSIGARRRGPADAGVAADSVREPETRPVRRRPLVIGRHPVAIAHRDATAIRPAVCGMIGRHAALRIGGKSARIRGDSGMRFACWRRR